MSPPLVLNVLLDQGLYKELDYLPPDNYQGTLTPGMRLTVPLRTQTVLATLIAVKDSSPFKNLKRALEIKGESVITPNLFKLAEWVSKYYCCPFKLALKAMLPSSLNKETKPKTEIHVEKAVSYDKLAAYCAEVRTKHPAQAKVCEVLLENQGSVLLKKLLLSAKVSKSPVETLRKKKLLSVTEKKVTLSPLDACEYFLTKPKKLNPEQESALNKLEFNKYNTHLLFGVTGSGKTEVYLQAIAKARLLNQGVIACVPEIALTAQTIERFRSRFSEKIGVLHHRLSDSEKRELYQDLQKGVINIVIGARSSIFAPVKNLGLVIIDEEHDSSYKQTDLMPCYHARDVAIMRASIEKFPVILGSATPSLETFTNALNGKYALSYLTHRATDAMMPDISIVNMKHEHQKAGGFTLFSDQLLDTIKRKTKLGEQVLLFLNRRGYHTFQLCQNCDKSVQCPHCATSLTFHKGGNALTCHMCQFTLSPPPRKCPSCKSDDTLKYKGVGTELVEKSLNALLPDVRTLRMDADTTKKKGSHETLFKKFRSGKADILIGTQMIAKGLHFPSVTLVGILNPDGALNMPDFRASEHIFQLLMQVSGRAGRGDLKGEVIIQTQMIDHLSILRAKEGNYRAFYDEELEARKMFGYPPFEKLAKLTFKGKDEAKTLSAAQNIFSFLKSSCPKEITIYPPSPSGYAKIKDTFRFQILLKSASISLLTSHLQALPPLPPNTRLLIDIDPISTFF